MDKKVYLMNLITVLLFLSVIIGFSAAFILSDDIETSPLEGRRLKTYPEYPQSTSDGEITFKDALFNGMFSTEINEYFCDQFPMRGSFVSLKALSETALLKRQNNGVLLGSDGQLAVRSFKIMSIKDSQTVMSAEPVDYFDKELVEMQIDTLNRLSEMFKTLDKPFVAVLPPRTIDVAISAFDYPSDSSDELRSMLNNGIKENYIDLTGMFREKYDNGEYVYNRTDHHWTTLGAYYAYAEIMKGFGLGDEVFPLSDFNTICAADDFYGTTIRKAGFGFTPLDTINLYEHKEYPSDMFTTEIVSGDKKSFSGFYDYSCFETLDKYKAFIGGTNKYTKVYRTDGVKSKNGTLLIVKDSFAHSLVPFLALHFDLEIVNLQSDGMNLIGRLATEEKYSADRVLLCYNLENVISTDRLLRGESVARIPAVK